MTKSTPSFYEVNPFMVIFGAIVVLSVALYFIFFIANTFGLEDKQAVATVLKKEYKAAGQTYVTQVIGGRTQTLPQITPEMHILIVSIGEKQAEVVVEKSVYNGIYIGAKISVTYQERRITGHLQILGIK